MTADEARALLDRMKPVPQCQSCWMKNPPTITVNDIDKVPTKVHENCPKEHYPFLPIIVESSVPLLTIEECHDALFTLLDQYAMIDELVKLGYGK